MQACLLSSTGVLAAAQLSIYKLMQTSQWPSNTVKYFEGIGWRRGIVVSGIHRMNEVNARRARLLRGWVTVFGRVCNKPTRSTQPCIPPGSLNRVPASAGVRAGMSPLPGGR